jgi:hypothetical protein
VKISMPIKIILGILTAWVVIYPIIFILAWIILSISLASQPNQYSSAPYWLGFLGFPIFLLIICSAFLQIGLKAFYLVHIIVNKSGGDVTRAILGVGLLFFSSVAMPVYYFIYILPETPPKWAQISTTG